MRNFSVMLMCMLAVAHASGGANDPPNRTGGVSQQDVGELASPVRPADTRRDGIRAGSIAVLMPGGGFSGPTSTPEQIGAGPGSDAVAIALWDVVPHQTIDGGGATFTIGALAFHINRIDRLEISVDGGPWTSVREMSVNPQTGVAEYCATLRADQFPRERQIAEVRAIAYPVAGIPRLLDPLYLNVSNPVKGADPAAESLIRYVSPKGNDGTGDGSELRPFATMRRAALAIQAESGLACADNGTIYLLAGDHAFGGEFDCDDAITKNAFLTIEPAPGLRREQVRITSGGRLDTKLVRLRNLTVYGAKISCSRQMDAIVWFDGCVLDGAGKENDITFASRNQWTGGIYATDTEVRNVRTGLSGTQLLRNVHVRDTLSDAMSNSRLIVNCTVDGIDKGKSPDHPDVLQWYIKRPLDNVIVYGLTATNAKAQGIFASGDSKISNIALVNVLIEMDSDSYVNQWRCRADHVLFWNTSIVNRPFSFKSDEIRNLGIRDSVFFELRGVDPRKFRQSVENNHFIRGNGLGGKFTLGNPAWVDADKDVYEPASGSPLIGRVISPLVPRDASGNAVVIPGSLGAVQPRSDAETQQAMQTNREEEKSTVP